MQGPVLLGSRQNSFQKPRLLVLPAGFSNSDSSSGEHSLSKRNSLITAKGARFILS